MTHRFALLLACFLLSGFAALLYQTAWTRELSFVFGTSELAVAAVLAAYMGGLALGSALAAPLAQRLRRPVLAYGVLELSIALSALAVPLGLRGLDALYGALLGGQPEIGVAPPAAATALQLAGAFAVLLPPTVFMGATLPLLARDAVRDESEIGPRVGILYAVNTAGAIAGTVCAAFFLIPELGLRQTVWVGAGVNAVVFLLAWLGSRGAPPALAPPEPAAARAAEGSFILPLIAVSGAVSFAYEVLWTRLLGQLLGGSLQGFATMLASFLLGIALGSAVASRLARDRERARLGFVLAQLGIAASSVAAFLGAARLPELSLRLATFPGADAIIAAIPLLPVTLCVGATFPFAVRVLAGGPGDAARATARVYAWNTVGAIAGALGAGFLLLPELGFRGTLVLGTALNLLLAAAAALAVAPRRGVLAAGALALAAVIALLPPAPPWPLLRFSPLRGRIERGGVVYFAVGRSSSVLLLDQGPHHRLFTNGLPEAVIERPEVLPLSSAISRWLGMLAPLMNADAREMLVVGLGGGVVVESVPGGVEQIDVVELEPAVIEANRRVSGEREIDPLVDPRVRIVDGDARGALRLTGKRYDAIVSQPSHPWTAGASHLYTREFFELAREHLAPEGVFVQWIGLGFLDEELLRSMLATLLESFDHVEVYSFRGRGLLFGASVAPLDTLESARRALARHPEDFLRFGLSRVEDVAAARVLDSEGARALAEGSAPNTDDDNQLAARASRLGVDVLDAAGASELFERHEPLRGSLEGLDVGALARSLVLRGEADRARRVAEALGGAQRERALGWLEATNNRLRSGRRHFERLLEIDPDSEAARIGLVATQRTDLEKGPVPEIDEARLPEAVRAVVEAWRAAEAQDWQVVAASEPLLASFAPGEPLFREAARLRVRWRLEQGGAEECQEALQLADVVLRQFWEMEDALLHARAALAAERPRVAWAGLGRLADLAPSNARGSDALRRGLALSEALPPAMQQTLRPQLERSLRPRPEGEV